MNITVSRYSSSSLLCANSDRIRKSSQTTMEKKTVARMAPTLRTVSKLAVPAVETMYDTVAAIKRAQNSIRPQNKSSTDRKPRFSNSASSNSSKCIRLFSCSRSASVGNVGRSAPVSGSCAGSPWYRFSVCSTIFRCISSSMFTSQAGMAARRKNKGCMYSSKILITICAPSGCSVQGAMRSGSPKNGGLLVSNAALQAYPMSPGHDQRWNSDSHATPQPQEQPPLFV
mmetsp:Transcript_33705/g.92362  ORF Transcript_33705/g.92362 Transcript_33705/m.92362 type:complete len:228 (-) Transcript_33705:1347-2030(-)